MDSSVNVLEISQASTLLSDSKTTQEQIDLFAQDILLKMVLCDDMTKYLDGLCLCKSQDEKGLIVKKRKNVCVCKSSDDKKLVVKKQKALERVFNKLRADPRYVDQSSLRKIVHSSVPLYFPSIYTSWF
jgi:hypothetical protein